MLPAEREHLIITFLKTNKKATIHDLAIEFKVHEATIRRDLNKLEQFNQIKRTHGGVVLNDSEVWDELNFDDRESSYYYEKLAIGHQAAEFVENGDTLFIDSGSTTIHFARALTQKNNLTIITNDIHIASILKSTSNQVIVTGGILYKDNYLLNGMITNDTLKLFNPSKLFLATPALDLEKGVTHFNETLTSTKIQMVNQAKQIYVLTDSSKLDKVSLYNVCPTHRIDTLITDHTNHKINWTSYETKLNHLVTVDTNICH
ncbi:DeoR/GlpR family DNA-binding transcription regulator [Staphylococcus edaphicus]|uniref:DeoR/GlpR family DNA-binding transcription regulator n=1 Tax=Staphylococcus edaphicus TaxID=1955013 RepID=A0A2C6VGJ1_9STAP|nr:DeoR/GlpR family DNA-binding transcription regulator [Staphylococcus edaphicus]PHK49411.1 transcriptional regulator [Staphylococcus edaphicus]UQW81234.1 DeoR/GlpR family DNA-binding transcription regulator [Staphylococcus edaphicus]